jgi:hypothetical protein
MVVDLAFMWLVRRSDEARPACGDGRLPDREHRGTSEHVLINATQESGLVQERRLDGIFDDTAKTHTPQESIAQGNGISWKILILPLGAHGQSHR